MNSSHSSVTSNLRVVIRYRGRHEARVRSRVGVSTTRGVAAVATGTMPWAPFRGGAPNNLTPASVSRCCIWHMHQHAGNHVISTRGLGAAPSFTLRGGRTSVTASARAMASSSIARVISHASATIPNSAGPSIMPTS